MLGVFVLGSGKVVVLNGTQMVLLVPGGWFSHCNRAVFFAERRDEIVDGYDCCVNSLKD